MVDLFEFQRLTSDSSVINGTSSMTQFSVGKRSGKVPFKYAQVSSTTPSKNRDLPMPKLKSLLGSGLRIPRPWRSRDESGDLDMSPLYSWQAKHRREAFAKL